MYKVISWSNQNLRSYGSLNLASNVHFYKFWELSLLWIFSLTTNFEYSIFCAHQCTLTSIMRIFGASQVLGSFRFDSVFSPILVVFGQYCLSLRAIISIIKRDNWLLDGCFGKLKRYLSICKSVVCYLFSTQMPNSGRKISLKSRRF